MRKVAVKTELVIRVRARLVNAMAITPGAAPSLSVQRARLFSRAPAVRL